MRRVTWGFIVMVAIVAATQMRSSATPNVLLVSPPIINSAVGDQLLCLVTNSDDMQHMVTFRWCYADGTCSDYSPQVVPSHGTVGAASSTIVKHCEVVADGQKGFYRAVFMLLGEGAVPRIAVPFD